MRAIILARKLKIYKRNGEKKMKFRKRRSTRVVCAVLAGLMMSTSLAGCGGNTGSSDVTVNPEGLPITNEKSELTAYMVLHTNHAGVGVTSLSDVASVKALEEKTNVHIEWESPTNSNAKDIMAQMLASGDYPEIMVTGIANKNVRQAGIAIPLNDLIDKYAPNVKKLMEEYPEYEYFSKDENGQILSVNSFTPDLRFNAIWCTPMIRQDWLDKLGLPVPNTQEEWYNTLKAFKENDMNGNGDPNDEIPMVIHKAWPMDYLAFWPLGINDEFYVEDGKVKYGFLQPEYLEGVKFMKKLYDEKLVDTEFLVQNIQQMEKKIQSNLAGACLGSSFNYGIEYQKLLAETVPEYNMITAGNIMSKDGKRYSFASNVFQRFSESGFYITDKCKNPELAMRWIDYLFSEEGGTIAQFGKEGESFDYDANGKPQFRYDLLKDESGVINALNRSKYTLGGDGSYGTAFPHWDEALVKDENGIWKPEDKTAIFGSNEIFDRSYQAGLDMDIAKLMPEESMMRYTAEEEAEINQLMTDITKFVDETTAQFVTGAKSLDEYEAALETLKNLKIDRAIEIKQAAYDRIDKDILAAIRK